MNPKKKYVQTTLAKKAGNNVKVIKIFLCVSDINYTVNPRFQIKRVGTAVYDICINKSFYLGD